MHGRVKADIFPDMDRLMQIKESQKLLTHRLLTKKLPVAAFALAGLLLRGRAR
mgnify:CR=1 FL=1